MRLLLLLVLAGVAPAQYDLYDLATNGDGSTAWFVTALPAKGGAASYSDPGRVYTVGPGPVQLFLGRTRTETPPITQIGQIEFTNYYRLSTPQASRDGKVVAVVGQRDCVGGSRCSTQTTLTTTVSGLSAGAVDLAGAGRLSGNGRYLYISSFGHPGGQPGVLVDLTSGQSTTVDLYAAYSLGVGRVVADDGTVVSGAGQLQIARSAGTERIDVGNGSPVEAVIDAAASVVVYTQYDWNTYLRSIRVYHIAERRDAALAPLPGAESHTPYVSADGRRAMFLSDASGSLQIYTVNTDGTLLRQVTREASGVPLASMSDDGRIAWYFSGAGRLYRIDLDSGAAEEKMGRTPQPQLSMRLAAGSINAITGAGLSDEASSARGYPLPRALGTVSVSIGGSDAPLLLVSPTTILVQIPWGASGDTAVEVRTAASSPFEARVRLPVTVLPAYPTFLTVPKSPSGYGGWSSLAVHGDWSAGVDATRPAQPNEVVHLFGTGFGRVNAPPEDGMPAPADPLAHTVVPVTCWAWGADNITRLDIPVLFAGLAPGTVGYYQLDLRLPGGNLRADTQLVCTGEGDSHDFLGSVKVRQ